MGRIARALRWRPWQVSLAAGLVVLAAAGAWLWHDLHHAPPYRYVEGAVRAPADLGPLAPFAERGYTVHEARVLTGDGQRELATLDVATGRDGPLLVDWKPAVDEPFLHLLPAPSETTELAPVLARHVPTGTTLLAWWDTSRMLGALSGVHTAFDRNLDVPLFLPAAWQPQRAAAMRVESDFWKAPDDAAARERFDRFVHALSSNERDGMAELRALTGGKPAVLALHLRDMILLAQLAPQRIGLAFRDFPELSDVHGMVRGVRGWLESHGYTAYAVMRTRDKHTRVVALTDRATGETLAARLLPFIGNRQESIAGTTLVYKVGGYSVYEIGSDDTVAAK